ncbi:MAG: DASH family cryptochrome [Bacteroidota bacterium]
MPTALLWLRHDLRLHDHAPLRAALDYAGSNGRLLAVYCLDPRDFETTAWGVPKTGGHRARFLLDSLADLRARMRERGGDLVIRRGTPEEIIPGLVRQSSAGALFYHDEPMQEEADTEDAVLHALPDHDAHVFWGHTLVDLDTLPFDMDGLPDVFTQFRKAAERTQPYPSPLPAPDRLAPLPDGIEPGEIPSVADLGVEPLEIDARAAIVLRGGETEGLKRVEAYLWEGDHLREYKETRNGMLGENYSSKFSAWLAHGCLSPRQIADEVRRYEDQRVSNRSTYWMLFELLWRDFFRLYGAKYGDRLFWLSGPSDERGMPNRVDEGLFAKWREGRTGFPLVDANMIELRTTGFMSNRGRQNAASFWVKHMRQDWRAGAAWFEAMLADYDVTSNWGNWAYVAGVGSDPRDRYFDIETQGKKYDEDAAYVKHWIPALDGLPPKLAREPYRMTEMEQEMYGVRVGEQVPAPILDYDRETQRLRGSRGKPNSGGRPQRGRSSRGRSSQRARR